MINFLEESGAALLILLLLLMAAAIYFNHRRTRRLAHQRDALLLEKDLVFNFLQDVGDIFAGSDKVDINELLRRVLFYALRTTKAGAGAIYLLDEDGETLRAQATSGIFPPLIGGLDEGAEKAFSKTRYVETLVRKQVGRAGQGLIGTVAATGLPFLVRNAELDARIPRFNLDFLRVNSLLAVPMRFHNKALGVLIVVNRVDEMPFIQADQNLLQALADQASVSIYYAHFSAVLDEKRRLDYDLNVAQHIQTALLPKTIPTIAGVELAAFSLPAQQIGGDYYDFVEIDADHFGIAVADVSGKGISGAMVMSLCRSALRINAPGRLSPAEVLRRMQQIICADLADDMYITMLYMILNPRTLELRVARAGHVSPIVNPGSRAQPWTIDSRGMAIGLADTETFNAALEERVVQLNPGDIVVNYTDGVTEAMDQRQNEWGLLSLVKTIQLSAIDMEEEGHVVERLVDSVRQRLLLFVGNTPQYDDMTMVALRIPPRKG